MLIKSEGVLAILLGLPVLLVLVTVSPVWSEAIGEQGCYEFTDKISLAYKEGDYSKALELSEQAYACAMSQFGSEHPKLLPFVKMLSAFYYVQGNYSEAKKFLKKEIQLDKKTQGEMHPDIPKALTRLAALYYAEKRYSETEQALKKSLQIGKKVLGKEDPVILETLRGLAELYKFQGRYSEAEPFFQEVLQVSEKTLGGEHPDTLISINNLAKLYKLQGRYKEAKLLQKKALLISLRALVGLYESQDNYSEAKPLYKDILQYSEELAGAYKSQGRYSEAEPLFKEALRLREKMQGREHPDTLISINNLAALYESQGRYSEAELLYKEAFQLGKNFLGKDHSDTLTYLGNLARLYSIQGHYSEAESLSIDALRRRDRVLGRKHPDTLVSISNLAGVYYAQGRYNEAEALYKEALWNYEKFFGKEHPDTLALLGNLTILYESQGSYSEAESLAKEVLRRRDKVLGRKHPDTLLSVSNLASLYYAQGRYNEAETLYKEVLHIRKKVLGKEHPDTLTSINNLAGLYQSQGLYSEAEQLYNEFFQLSEKALGVEHPYKLTTLQNYIILLVSDKRSEYALSRLEQLERHLLSRSFRELYASSSEKVRRIYLESISGFQHIVLSFSTGQTKKEYQHYAAEVMLRWKQVYAEESSVQHRLFSLNNDPETAELRTQLTAAQANASQALFQPKEKQSIPELIEKANQDETALLALARHLRTGLEVQDVTLDKVLSALPKHSGLIEYRLFSPVDFKTGKLGERHLAALLLLADPKAKQRFVFRDLGPFAEIEKHLQDKIAEAYKRLLGPFDEQIKSLKQLYIAPDDPLSLLSFASLRLPDGRFLAERQQINRLQTGRDLIKNGKDFPRGKGLVAIGGAEYGKLPAGQTQSTPKLAASYQQRAAQMLWDGVAFLKNSGPEAQTIGKIYTNNISEDAQIFLGNNASEYNLKHLKQPPRILHLSTHGFFLAKEEKSRLADEAPLLLSGLTLAGANNGLQGKLDKHGDDGLLYSLEVLGLNLQGTELVSLSACDTGKGVIDYSEGVYGLVRAFRTAGAKNVLMTLTPVGDEVSKDFMTTFYDNWLSSEDNISPAQALHKTRLDFIHHKNTAYRDPAVWSPYVLVGK
ncbi:hypothetical protein GMJAKD_07665 [Candidatus Electrothrix aarhusensis]